MTLHPRLRLTAALAGLLAAGVIAAPPATADHAEPIDILGCALFGGGELDVEAGPAHLFLDGWGTGTRGQLVHWMKSQTSTLTIQVGDGATVTQDVADLRSSPTRFDEGGWGSFLLYDVFLSPGEVTVTFRTSWTKPTTDFIPASGNHPVLQRGDDREVTCVLTVH